MIKRYIIPAILLTVFFGCKKKEPAPIKTNPGDTTVVVVKPNNQHISVFTQHNDNTRAGLNNRETALTTANVNSSKFGLLYTLRVDDQVYAQPLVVGNLTISGAAHNVVLIATVNNTIYAFDGDNGKLYWKKNYTQTDMRPPQAADMASSWCAPYQDISASIGIIGTPVIDSASATMYFVARSTDGTNFVQNLHAINIATGSEQVGSPVNITATVPGNGDGSSGNMVAFDPRRNNQRQALSLVKGVVYISFASHCDWNPYHGWILGYNAKSLQQQTIYNDTPNGEAGGLWESGMGMAADAQGNLYVVSGNGTVGLDPYTASINGTTPGLVNADPTDPTNRGESAMKLTPSGNTLKVASYFTPSNYYDLDMDDLDYGVMGAILIPNSNLFLTGCKSGDLFLLNKDNMGGFLTTNTIQQTIPLNDVGLHCQPAYYKGSSKQFVYVWSESDQLRAFELSGGLFNTNPAVSADAGPVGPSGADLAVSSNGTTDGTGILWAAYGTSGDAGGAVGSGILRAFDASDITKELWNSEINIADRLGSYAKFCSPTIANGHVYMASFSNLVQVYGLK